MRWFGVILKKIQELLKGILVGVSRIDCKWMFFLMANMENLPLRISKLLNDFSEKYKGYLKIKKLMEEIEAKYAQRDGKVKDDIPVMISYE